MQMVKRTAMVAAVVVVEAKDCKVAPLMETPPPAVALEVNDKLPLLALKSAPLLTAILPVAVCK